jgi:TetR/AcrR family transcriptional regulator, cholesterol catabolism regulator
MLETTRRRAIEDAASDLFRRQGYAATSVRDIAGALDMRGASLYSHVASKEDVLWSIVDRVATRFEQAADRAVAGADDPALTLARLVRAHVAAIVEDVGEASVFIHEWRHLSPERRSAVLARRDAYEARFRGVIDAGIAEGTFAITDPAIAATFLLTALNGIPTWYQPSGPVRPADLGDRYAEMTVRSLTETTR